MYNITARQALWSAEYAKLLTFNETFFIGAKNDSALVNKTHKIVLPQSTGSQKIIAGAEGTWTDLDGNAVTYPVAPVAATFDVLEYDVTKRAFEPFYIYEEDDKELTINGRSEKLDETVRFMKEKIAAVISHGWVLDNAENYIRTTDTNTRTNEFGNASAKALTYDDIVKAGLNLNRQKVPMEGRRLLVTPTMYADLLKINELKGVNVFQPTYDQLINGKVGRIAGFDVYLTQNMASFTSLLAKKPLIGATDAATDLECAIAYHPSFVRYGIGDQNIKISQTVGLYTMADPIEGWARVGSTPAYKADATSNIVNGIVTIIEGV